MCSYFRGNNNKHSTLFFKNLLESYIKIIDHPD
jgi:hypothetical protein